MDVFYVLALLIGNVFVFTALAVLALPTLSHPKVVAVGPWRHLTQLVGALAIVGLVSGTFAVLGLGVVSWWLWAGTLASVLFTDVQSVRARRKLRKLAHRAVGS